MNKFFYFRNVDVITDDDGQANSLNIPVNRITGIEAKTADTVTIYYESKLTDLGDSAFGDQAHNNPSITLNITSGARKPVMEAMAIASNAEPHDDGMIVIADDVTKTYFHKNITSVGSITESTQFATDVDDA